MTETDIMAGMGTGWICTSHT